jgi:hypothetical protein
LRRRRIRDHAIFQRLLNFENEIEVGSRFRQMSWIEFVLPARVMDKVPKELNNGAIQSGWTQIRLEMWSSPWLLMEIRAFRGAAPPVFPSIPFPI